jgi:membrane protein DedA with SNARE-associated domain
LPLIDVAGIADSIGYPAAALGILIESAGIPFPGEVALLAVSAYAAAGHLRIWLVILLGALGAASGADIGYSAGYFGGRPFVERFGRALHLDPSNLARSELFFARHGDKAIVAMRFVVGLRTWGSVLAGMSRMPFWRFQLYSAVGGVLWAFVVGMAGYLLGSNWPLFERGLTDFGVVVIAVLAAAGLTLFLLRRRVERGQRRQRR